MRKVLDFLFSMKLALVLLLLFAAAIGTATFIEEKYDTETARMWVYNAKWFEIILLLLALSYILNIRRYRLLRKEKFPALLFHLAFILLIAGAGVTRYISFDGMMRIREGQASNIMYSTDPCFQVKASGPGLVYSYDKPLYLGQGKARALRVRVDTKGKGDILVTGKRFLKNAITQTGENGNDVLIVNVEYLGKNQEVQIHATRESRPEFSEIILDGITLQMAYGSREIRLPFSLYLEDFVLERYAGSMSPSSYASQVTLIDEPEEVERPFRIYMNHVLDYRGYRFFQSSYDPDEQGTILSVNHDLSGTLISYTGYLLLGIGFFLNLFSRNSRFSSLSRSIRKIRATRKGGVAVFIAMLILCGGTVFSQQEANVPVSKVEAEQFGHLLVQTYDGRFEPIHTLAYDVMHKISGKDQFNIGMKGDLDGMQVFLDMMVDPDFWRQQKIIRVREKSVRSIIGVTGLYACFDDFIDQRGGYKLTPYAEEAFRKSPASQNAFDKEIIRVDERLNIQYTLFTGSLLKIFPLQGSQTHTWISFTDTLANLPFTGALEAMNSDLGMKDPSYSTLMRYYLTAVYQEAQTGDYTQSRKALERIARIQRAYTPSELLPSDTRVSVEIFYNKARIFTSLKNWYGLLSLVLLALAFADNLRIRTSRVITYLLNFFIFVLALAFLYHTFGMGLRWYLTGHAPWSNGYEALLVVAWGGLLAGFSFVRYSKITLAATALLAFSILMTASHSSYDPQLTNLQPVLKSYWLVIHVAVITISYGFLAVGFILGLINLLLSLFKTRRNFGRLDLVIRELTLTSEMALSVGIVLATLGTFLGGVWANESWGRYWGWDAKETWALVIVITYAIILHLRLIPKMCGPLTFNAASVLGFGSVVMTFVGVNYYLSKGLHSYAAGEKAVFPLWAWIIIVSVILLIAGAVIKEKRMSKAG